MTRDRVSNFELRISSLALILVSLASFAKAADPTPTPTPGRASENPEDIRARLPRPTPFDSETKVKPPQQSAEEEARTSNRPGEPDLLHGEPSVLLDGIPFPERRPYDPKFPEARRLRYAAGDAPTPGDGSLEHPWKDLQQALCALEPGDRLVVGSGIYAGAFRIAGSCRSGTADAPIQVFARHAFLKSDGHGDVLTVERAHWQLWEVQLALLDSESTGLVISGPDAHDIAVDQSHIYEGKGPAVRVAAGSSRITLSNCHIHQSMGVRIDAGASAVTLINNHIHHNRSASVTVGGGPAATAAPAREISLFGNRIHNDRGPALDLSRCEGVSIARNRLSNYRPNEDDGRGGEAILVRAGCRNVVFENNSVLEASVGVRVGDPTQPGPAPEEILLKRSYFENKLTKDSAALVIEGGRDIRFQNNVVDRYAEPFRIGASGVEGVSIANNLILEPAVAFTLSSTGAVVVFDYNVYGGGAGLKAATGTPPAKTDAAAWMAVHMPHSHVVQGLDLGGGDLAKVSGFSTVDAGKALEGVLYQGSAPDIGVAEH
jgi:hypothetical protein